MFRKIPDELKRKKKKLEISWNNKNWSILLKERLKVENFKSLFITFYFKRKYESYERIVGNAFFKLQNNEGKPRGKMLRIAEGEFPFLESGACTWGTGKKDCLACLE